MAILGPHNLVTTLISSSRITMLWDNRVSYDAIEVWEDINDAGNYSLKDTISGTKEYYSSIGLDSNTKYCYKVRGIFYPAGTTAFSNFDCETTKVSLEPPTDVVATPISDTEIDITFKDNADDEDNHRLERKLGAGEWGFLVNLEPNKDFYRDTGLVKGSSYTYRVRAEAAPADPTAYATSSQVTTIEEPSTPTLAAILDADTKDKSIRIRWSNVANETGYRIEKDTVEIAVVGAGITDFLVTGLTPDVEYDFRVRAYNAAGNSAYSAVRSKTTDAIYVPTEFEKWIRTPKIKSVYLAEIYTKMTLTGFTLESGVVWKKTIDASDRGIDILEVFEEGTAYAEKTSIATVQATAQTFWFDYDNRILYIHTTGGANPNTFDLIEGAFWLYFSTHKDIEFTINGRLNYFLPLLSKEDIPSLSQEIKSYFEGNFGISSGAISFKNDELTSKKFFDKKFATYTWLNSKIILKAGKEDFTYAQFKEVFTAYINDKSCDDRKITFQLLGIQKKMEGNISLNKFNVTDYPGMIDEDGNEDRFIDKPIPIGFGLNEFAVPVAVDIGNGKFKFNDSSIVLRSKSVNEVRRNGAVLVEDTHYYVDLQRSIITFSRDGAFVIAAGVNDKINFKEGGGGELTATLDPDTYTTAELLVEIKAKMEAANALIFTVTCPSATKKFKIAASGGFSLLWKTGTNGTDGTDTSVASTIGFHSDEDREGDTNYEADENVITPTSRDIMEVTFAGFVNSADELIENGAELFKYLLNNYKEIENSGLNLDSIYQSKYANTEVLSIYIDKEISFNGIIRKIEHSIEAYAFQDELGRLGIKPQQTTAASKAKYIIAGHTFSHSQKKSRGSLFWKVIVNYNKNLQTDDWETKEAIDNEIYWKYGVTEELEIDTYFHDPAAAQSLATSILSLVNKATISNELPMLLFDVLAGDLVKFSRTRFYDSDGTASEITLRIIKITKTPGSERTTIIAEEV